MKSQKQTKLFDIKENQPVTNSLLINASGNSNRILSKNEQIFNKLIKKIESLEKKLISTEIILNEKLSFYINKIRPLDNSLINLKLEYIKLLHKHKHQKESFSKNERAALKDLLIDELNDYLQLQNGDIDDKTKQIFKDLHGLSIEDAEKMDFEDAKNEFKNRFAESGIDMDFDDMHAEMSEEEVFRKINEMKQKISEQQEHLFEKKKQKPKTKKQLAQELKEKEIEETKNKSISTIYKQLAKILHPDLERDEVLRIEKEEYMKQLNVAYKKKDIHTLLKLELMWITKVENVDGKLTDDKLKIYIEVLKEQIGELEESEYRIMQHPRYESLHKFAVFPHQLKNLNLALTQKSVEKKIADFETNIKNLNSSKYIAEIKKILQKQSARNQRTDFDFSDLMSNFRF